MLVRYWIKFEGLPFSDILSLGCGVTAYSREDALGILRSKVFGNRPFEISEIVENVDVSRITDPHIRPNMGIPVIRGVWFPLGYD